MYFPHYKKAFLPVVSMLEPQRPLRISTFLDYTLSQFECKPTLLPLIWALGHFVYYFDYFRLFHLHLANFVSVLFMNPNYFECFGELFRLPNLSRVRFWPPPINTRLGPTSAPHSNWFGKWPKDCCDSWTNQSRRWIRRVSQIAASKFANQTLESHLCSSWQTCYRQRGQIWGFLFFWTNFRRRQPWLSNLCDNRKPSGDLRSPQEALWLILEATKLHWHPRRPYCEWRKLWVRRSSLDLPLQPIIPRPY